MNEPEPISDPTKWLTETIAEAVGFPWDDAPDEGHASVRPALLDLPENPTESDRVATYEAALASGLSDYEAREEGWPSPRREGADHTYNWMGQCKDCAAGRETFVFDGAIGHDAETPCTRTTAFFFKQWGGRTPKAGGRLLDGRTHDGAPD